MIITNILDKAFQGLKVEKLLKSDTCETILIRIEANHSLPKHTTAKETLLIMQQGEAIFHINGKEIVLKQGDTFHIPIDVEHSVFANKDTILFIIR